MAYRHARSGVTESGVTEAGLVNKNIDVRIAGTERNPLREVAFRVSKSLDGGPSMCSFMLMGTKPVKFQDIVLLRGTADSDIYWAGTIMTVSSDIIGEVVRWQVTAVDWTWLLSRYRPVTAVFRNVAVNTVLTRLIRDFADPASGFRVGYCPSTLGAINEIRFDNLPLHQAITSLAKAASAYARIRPNKHIDIAQIFPDGNPLLVNDPFVIRDFRYAEEGALVANRVRVIGRGTQTTAVVASGVDTIPVDDCSVFVPSGGRAQSGQNTLTYTGTSVVAGPGSLTGCTGIAGPIEQGAEVRVLAIAEDVAAQAALAAALGGGRSGVAEIPLSDARWTDEEARGVAAAYLAFYKSAEGMPSVDVEVDDANFDTGKIMTLNLTDPIVVTGDFRIQTVEISYDDDLQVTDTLPRLEHRVSGRIGRRADVLDVLVPR